jgi:hypothetical protein
MRTSAMAEKSKRLGNDLLAGLKRDAGAIVTSLLSTTVPQRVRDDAIAMQRAIVDGRQLGLDDSESLAIIAKHIQRSVKTSDPVGWVAVRNDMIHEATTLHTDTLDAWLFYRYGGKATKGDGGAAWRALVPEDRLYWQHEADAVRRAVKRNGFK